MSQETRPEDRIAFPRKVAYGMGGFVNNLLAAAIGQMAAVLPLSLGMSFASLGLLQALPRLTDAVTDPLMGFISDRTRSRWGRRRPWIFVGALIAGVTFALLWVMPAPTQLRVKLVDYGEDGVYSGEVGEPESLTETLGAWFGGLLSPESTDDSEHEVAVLAPRITTGTWVGLDLPLADFGDLRSREHLAQLLLSGDLTEFYIDNVYLYRSDGDTPDQVVQGGPEGATAPNGGPPVPTADAGDVLSLFSDAYENEPVGWFSTDWDIADVEDVSFGGDEVKHYSGVRFAAIDFGEVPLDATEMTHLHLDIWTPEATSVGWSQEAYFWYFLIGSIIFFIGYTIFATPWVALGYELTPDYNERTRLMGVQTFVGNVVYLISPWFLAIMAHTVWFRNQMDGALILGLVIGVTVIILGIIPSLFLRERLAESVGAPEETERSTAREAMKDFLNGLLQTIKSKPFLMLCAVTFLVFNSFIMISSFQFWVFIYYVAGGSVSEGAALAGFVGTLGIFCGFGVIALVTWLGTKIGKSKALIVSTGVSMIGYALKWFCYNPEYPMLALVPAPFLAFGLSGLFTVMGAMVADVVDVDELDTGERREGMFGSIYWWVVKVGQSVALGAGGLLLAWTGLDPALGGGQSEQTIFLLRLSDAVIPFVASGIAVFILLRFPITEETAAGVRALLEKKRLAETTPE